MASDLNERVKIINELDKNLLVSASAGSGKTTILVERMVALVESGKVNLSKMAALTFTKKAAGEFYDRFYKKLQLRIKPDFSKAKYDKYSLLSEPTPETVKRDKEALAHIDTCFFGTIDSFYQKILNEHPLEAGLSSSAKIIDDDEYTNYIIRYFSECLKNKSKNISEQAEFFADLIGTKSFPIFMTDILDHKELELYQIVGNVGTLENSYKDLIKVFKDGCKVLVKNEDVLRPKKKDADGNEVDITKDNQKAWDFLIQNINRIAVLKEDDYRTAKKIFEKVEKLRFTCDDLSIFSGTGFSLGLMFEEKQKRNGSLDYYFVKNGALETLLKIVYIRVIDFFSSVKDEIYANMVNDGLLTFNIATNCLLNLLRNDEKYKTAIDQIRSKFDCILIDECQDTDMKQYEIFFRLVASDYKEDFKDLDIKGGKLYACGDRKQGIYHFRGADVSTYDYIKTIFESKKAAGFDFDLVTLTDNHRSKGKLINYFNDIFKVVLNSQGYPPILNDEIKNDEKDFGTFTYDTDTDRDPDEVAKLILKLKNEKGYSFKDFMVMTSSKESILQYSRAFAQYSIPCYGEGFVDVHVSPLLDSIIGIFKYISSRKTDLISYLEVLSSPLFNFDITKTIDLSHDYLEEIGVDYNLTLLPSSLLEKLTANTKILNILNCRGIDILIGLTHLLKEKENSGEINSYSDAIKYFNDLQNKELVIERLSLLSNNIDAVQIANAHKTKGLEKKVVILVKAGNNDRGPSIIKDDKYYIISHQNEYRQVVIKNPQADIPPVSTVVDKEKEYEEEETKRLLYVAATRARDYLYISNPKNKQGASDSRSKWYPLLVALNKSPDVFLDDEYKVDKKTLALKDTVISFDYDTKKKTFDIITPSKIESANKYNEEYIHSESERSDSLIFGTMVHKLLENIVKAKEYVLDDSICEYIANMYDRTDLVNELLQVKNTIHSGGYPQKECPFSDLLKEVKQYKTYTEVPFSYKDGNNVVNGNIDLIIEKDKEVIVIDYKTDVNEIDHKEQLDCYMNAIKNSKLFEGKTITSYIYKIIKI